MRSYWVYILANEWRSVLYVGVTGDIRRRLFEHRFGTVEGFTKRYRVNQLMYFEETADALSAIAREKQLKGGSRARKLELIRSMNPSLRDLYEEVMQL